MLTCPGIFTVPPPASVSFCLLQLQCSALESLSTRYDSLSIKHGGGGYFLIYHNCPESVVFPFYFYKLHIYIYYLPLRLPTPHVRVDTTHTSSSFEFLPHARRPLFTIPSFLYTVTTNKTNNGSHNSNNNNNKNHGKIL